MRNGLYMFRCSKRLSRSQMAEKIGCHRETYSAIERGDRDGRMKFWNALQVAFDIPDTEIGGLMKVEE